MATHSSVLAWRIPGTGAWWAAVYGVAQSQTRLTRLSSSTMVIFLQYISVSNQHHIHLKHNVIEHLNSKINNN